MRNAYRILFGKSGWKREQLGDLSVNVGIILKGSYRNMTGL
jgi:hypothetical protein